MAYSGEIRAVTGELYAASTGMLGVGDAAFDSSEQISSIDMTLSGLFEDDGSPIGADARSILNSVANVVAALVAREAELTAAAAEHLTDTDQAVAAGM